MSGRVVIVLIMIFIFLISGCSCGGNGSVVNGVVSSDVYVRCGVGRYESFDYQCIGMKGCVEVKDRGCGCRCSRCEDERCVEISCRWDCEIDGGVDVIYDVEGSEVRDVELIDSTDEDILDGGYVEDGGLEVGVDIRDAEVYDYVCKDPGDPEGYIFQKNPNKESIVYISRTCELPVITEDYVVWIEPRTDYVFIGRDIYYLSFKDRRVRRVPNCDGFQLINQLENYGNKIYWSNSANACSFGKCGVIFEFDMDDKKIRIVSMVDEAASPLVYENNMVYTIVGSLDKNKNGTYYRDLTIEGSDRKIDNDSNLVGMALYKTYFVYSGYTLDLIDIFTFEKKTLYTNSVPFWADVWGAPIVPIQQYIDKQKYGHPTTDIYVIDVDTGELKKITDDEEYQWNPIRYKNILIYHENEDIKSSDVGYGYLVVYDLETGVRRKVNGSEGFNIPISLGDGKVLYTDTLGSWVFPVYLMNLEKLGAIKDGHVVPE